MIAATVGGDQSPFRAVGEVLRGENDLWRSDRSVMIRPTGWLLN
jgi:hypothetical protein